MTFHSSLTEFSVTACLINLIDAFHWGGIDLRNLTTEGSYKFFHDITFISLTVQSQSLLWQLMVILLKLTQPNCISQLLKFLRKYHS